LQLRPLLHLSPIVLLTSGLFDARLACTEFQLSGSLSEPRLLLARSLPHCPALLPFGLTLPAMFVLPPRALQFAKGTIARLFTGYRDSCRQREWPEQEP
jgi:hypothetical protein